MIRRLRANKMDLQCAKQPLPLCQRQSDHLGRIFGHRRAAADLVDPTVPSGPINSNTMHAIRQPTRQQSIGDHIACAAIRHILDAPSSDTSTPA
jgi:hypothetical protein